MTVSGKAENTHSDCPILKAQGLCKSFGGVWALRHADLCIGKGEVIALLGDNGAGKSTLVNLLSGVWRRDGGSLCVAGQTVDRAGYNVQIAKSLGMETVYQDRALCEGQTLWRNLFIGRHIKNRFGLIDVAKERAITHEMLGDWFGLTGAGLDPDALVRVLSGGERQALAIGRAMYFGARLVILDEPTTGLSLKEVNLVMQFIDRLRHEGRSALVVSHHVHQAYAVADRFVFMHQGRTVGSLHRDETSPDDLSARLLRLAEGHESENDLHEAGAPLRDSANRSQEGQSS